ncbi:hypothetical protein MTO96_001554 [Rhipicephalus appendiculatus]
MTSSQTCVIVLHNALLLFYIVAELMFLGKDMPSNKPWQTRGWEWPNVCGIWWPAAAVERRPCWACNLLLRRISQDIEPPTGIMLSSQRNSSRPLAVG